MFIVFLITDNVYWQSSLRTPEILRFFRDFARKQWTFLRMEGVSDRGAPLTMRCGVLFARIWVQSPPLPSFTAVRPRASAASSAVLSPEWGWRISPLPLNGVYLE